MKAHKLLHYIFIALLLGTLSSCQSVGPQPCSFPSPPKLLPLPSCPPVGEGPFPEADAAQLAWKVAPIVYMHPLEPYKLQSPKLYFDSASLYYQDLRNTTDTRYQFLAGLPYNNTMQLQWDNRQFVSVLNSTRISTRQKEDILKGAPLSPDGLSTAEVYYTAFEPSRELWGFTYHLFYAFNGCSQQMFSLGVNTTAEVLDMRVCPFGTHEGDWERVTVLACKADGAIKQVGYSQHAWTEVLDCEGGECPLHEGHPVAYSALESHANYPQESPFVVYDIVNASMQNVSLVNLGGLFLGDRTRHNPSARFVPTPTNVRPLPDLATVAGRDAGGLEWALFGGTWGGPLQPSTPLVQCLYDNQTRVGACPQGYAFSAFDFGIQFFKKLPALGGGGGSASGWAVKTPTNHSYYADTSVGSGILGPLMRTYSYMWIPEVAPPLYSQPGQALVCPGTPLYDIPHRATEYSVSLDTLVNYLAGVSGGCALFAIFMATLLALPSVLDKERGVRSLTVTRLRRLTRRAGHSMRGVVKGKLGGSRRGGSGRGERGRGGTPGGEGREGKGTCQGPDTAGKLPESGTCPPPAVHRHSGHSRTLLGTLGEIFGRGRKACKVPQPGQLPAADGSIHMVAAVPEGAGKISPRPGEASPAVHSSLQQPLSKRDSRGGGAPEPSAEQRGAAAVQLSCTVPPLVRLTADISPQQAESPSPPLSPLCRLPTIEQELMPLRAVEVTSGEQQQLDPLESEGPGASTPVLLAPGDCTAPAGGAPQSAPPGLLELVQQQPAGGHSAPDGAGCCAGSTAAVPQRQQQQQPHTANLPAGLLPAACQGGPGPFPTPSPSHAPCHSTCWMARPSPEGPASPPRHPSMHSMTQHGEPATDAAIAQVWCNPMFARRSPLPPSSPGSGYDSTGGAGGGPPRLTRCLSPVAPPEAGGATPPLGSPTPSETGGTLSDASSFTSPSTAAEFAAVVSRRQVISRQHLVWAAAGLAMYFVGIGFLAHGTEELYQLGRQVRQYVGVLYRVFQLLKVIVVVGLSVSGVLDLVVIGFLFLAMPRARQAWGSGATRPGFSGWVQRNSHAVHVVMAGLLLVVITLAMVLFGVGLVALVAQLVMQLACAAVSRITLSSIPLDSLCISLPPGVVPPVLGGSGAVGAAADGSADGAVVCVWELINTCFYLSEFLVWDLVAGSALLLWSHLVFLLLVVTSMWLHYQFKLSMRGARELCRVAERAQRGQQAQWESP